MGFCAKNIFAARNFFIYLYKSMVQFRNQLVGNAQCYSMRIRGKFCMNGKGEVMGNRRILERAFCVHSRMAGFIEEMYIT